MTLCIALCDDDKIALNNELRLIKDVLNEKKIKHSIDIFSSPQKLLQSDTVYDIIFLDIEMAEMDGISLAEKISITNIKLGHYNNVNTNKINTQSDVHELAHRDYSFKQTYKLRKEIRTEHIHDNRVICLRVSKSLLSSALQHIPGKCYLQSEEHGPCSISSNYNGLEYEILIRPLCLQTDIRKP